MMPGCSKLARKVGVSLGFINFSCYTTWWQVVEAGEKERSETVHVSEHVWEAPWSGGAQALTVTTEGAQTFCWSALLSDIIFWESTGERVARILAGTAGFMFESLELAEWDASDGLNRRPPSGRLPAPSGSLLCFVFLGLFWSCLKIDRINSKALLCPQKTFLKVRQFRTSRGELHMWSDRHASLLPSDLVSSGGYAANVAIGVVSDPRCHALDERMAGRIFHSWFAWSKSIHGIHEIVCIVCKCPQLRKRWLQKSFSCYRVQA